MFVVYLAMADSDTVQALLSVCLAVMGILITLLLLLIYVLAFRVKRHFTYRVSFKDTNRHPNGTNQPEVHAKEDTAESNREHSQTREKTDEKDTDSLTRDISFRHFQRPEITRRAGKTTDSDIIEHAAVDEFPEITEHSAEGGENSVKIDHDNGTDVLNWALSIDSDQSLESARDTAEHPKTSDVLETTGMLEIPGYLMSTGNAEDTGNTGEVGYTEGTGYANWSLSLENDQISESTRQPVTGEYPETVRSQEIIQFSETRSYPEISENPGTEDSMKYTNSITLDHRQSDANGNPDAIGILETSGFPGHQETAKNPDTTEFRETAQNLETSRDAGTSHPGRSINYTKDTDILGIAFSNIRPRDEKKVTFSDNDSTYEIERKTVQQMRIDETSNYEFAKFLKR